MKKIPKPSPAFALAFVALIVALGGSAAALTGNRSDRGASSKLDLVKVKLNPLNETDPCESGKTGVFCGYDSISGLRGWTNLGGGYEPVTYAIDDSGVVHLQGALDEINSGGGPASFILPKKYRPAGRLQIAVAFGQENNCTGESCDESVAILQIEKDGRVEPTADAEGAGTYFGEGVTLDGVSFAAK